MTISRHVQQQFFGSAASDALIRLPPTVVTQYAARAVTPDAAARARRRTNLWTVDEHERFLVGLERFPHGPWKEISAIVGTKTTRQTMTHAQKYRQKIERRMRASGQSAGPFAATSTPPMTTTRLMYAPSMTMREYEATSSPSAAASEVRMHAGSTKAHTANKPGSVSSPLDVALDVFDASAFDRDLDALLQDLDPHWITTEVYTF